MKCNDCVSSPQEVAGDSLVMVCSCEQGYVKDTNVKDFLSKLQEVCDEYKVDFESHLWYKMKMSSIRGTWCVKLVYGDDR